MLLSRSSGTKVSFPSLTLSVNCISTALVTVLSSLLMLPKSSKQTKLSQPSMPSTDEVGKDYNITVSGEKNNKVKQKSFSSKVLSQRLGFHSTSL